MKYAVRYLSNSGNTEKVAEKVAKELNIEAFSIEKEINGNIDILFLGCPVNAFSIDSKMKEFISKLNNIKMVAVFATSAISKKIVYKEISKELMKKKIPCFDHNLYIKGEFKGLNKGRPNENDLKLVSKFVNEIIRSGINEKV